MPLPPSSTLALTVASDGFLPLVSFSFLYNPFNPGPIFFSSLSALWQTPHCSKIALPLAASPAAGKRLGVAVSAAPTTRTRNRFISTILQSRRCPRETGYPEFALISLNGGFI